MIQKLDTVGEIQFTLFTNLYCEKISNSYLSAIPILKVNGKARSSSRCSHGKCCLHIVSFFFLDM